MRATNNSSIFLVFHAMDFRFRKTKSKLVSLKTHCRSSKLWVLWVWMKMKEKYILALD